MKDLFVSFVIVLVILFVFLFLGGAFVFDNFWLSMVLGAFVIALVIHAFYKQSEKIEELEKRISILENQKNGE